MSCNKGWVLVTLLGSSEYLIKPFNKIRLFSQIVLLRIWLSASTKALGHIV